MPTELDVKSGVLIVGGSLAAVRTALALRSQKYEGGILIVGAEPRLPYDRPPLSKGFLDGTTDASGLTLLSRERAAAAGIRLMLGHAATALDPERKQVTLDSGARVSYERLVICTGARPRSLPGRGDADVHTLRYLDDAVRLRKSLRGIGRLAIIGGGLIGGEVASVARSRGVAVTMIDVSAAPLARLVGCEVADLLAGLYRDQGVALHFGSGAVALSGRAGGVTVDLADGTRVVADAVLAAIGVTPNAGWLAGSGIDVADGVACDEFGQVIGHAGLYAVGDVARWHQPAFGRPVRFEDWTSAHNQAVAVAHNIASPGHLRRLSAARYGWTDQFGLRVQLAGRPAAGGDRVLIGSSADPGCLLSAVADDSGRLVGAVTIGWPRAMAECRRAITEGRTVAETVDQLPNAQRMPAASPAGRPMSQAMDITEGA